MAKCKTALSPVRLNAGLFIKIMITGLFLFQASLSSLKTVVTDVFVEKRVSLPAQWCFAHLE